MPRWRRLWSKRNEDIEHSGVCTRNIWAFQQGSTGSDQMALGIAQASRFEPQAIYYKSIRFDRNRRGIPDAHLLSQLLSSSLPLAPRTLFHFLPSHSATRYISSLFVTISAICCTKVSFSLICYSSSLKTHCSTSRCLSKLALLKRSLLLFRSLLLSSLLELSLFLSLVLVSSNRMLVSLP